MTIVSVSGAAQLTAALNSARGGDTIQLASGDYGSLVLDGRTFSSDVTITSGGGAVFRDVDITGVSNLAIRNVDFTGSSRTSGNMVSISESSGITIDNTEFSGTAIGGVQNGLSVNNSSDIQLSNSELTDFYYGAAFRKVDNLRVLNNDVNSMDFDGLRFAQVNNVLIQGNYLHDMDGPVDGGHRDMIQFWTAETTTPSSNVTIRANVIDIGDGKMIQSVFVYNEAVLAGAGTGMYYRNFLIEGNHIEGVHPHGIYVGESIGLSIRNNTVVKDPTSAAYERNWEPVIDVADRSQNVTITGNIAHEIPGPHAGWTISGNKLVPLTYVPATPGTSAGPTSAGSGSSGSGSSGSGSGSGSTGSGSTSAGNDTLVGTAAADLLRGMAGNDTLRGLAGTDVLIGGTGNDIFDFDDAAQSSSTIRDVLRAGDSGRAFDGAGAATGDKIDLSGIDANAVAAGNQAFAYGSTGIGRVSVVEFGNTASLVRANTDNDATFEFALMIEDGAVTAATYTAADFML